MILPYKTVSFKNLQHPKRLVCAVKTLDVLMIAVYRHMRNIKKILRIKAKHNLWRTAVTGWKRRILPQVR